MPGHGCRPVAVRDDGHVAVRDNSRGLLIPAVLLLALLGTGQADAAPTIKCHVAPPQVLEQRSWLTIDGRKCWYIGPRRIDRSLLYWEREQPIEIEPMPLPVDAPAIRAQDEFEDRWNAQYDHRTARDPQPLEQWRLWP